MNTKLPKPGEVVWHGAKLFGSCDKCLKLIQVNKRGFGSLHICLSDYERAIIDNEIASKEEIARLLAKWDDLESLTRVLAGKMNMRNTSRVKFVRLTNKLYKNKYLNSDTRDFFNNLNDLMKELKKIYNKGYSFGSWITPKTADSLSNSMDNYKTLIQEIAIS